MKKIIMFLCVTTILVACSDEKAALEKAQAESQAVCDKLQKELNKKKDEGLGKDDWNNFLDEFNQTVPKDCTITGNGRILY